MFNNIFGKKKQDPNKISSELAAGLVVQTRLEKLTEEWPALKEQIIGYDEAFGHVEGSWVEYEVFLAAIGADLLALHNLFPDDKAEELQGALIDCLGSNPDIGEIAVNGVGEYFSVAKLAIERNDFPIEYVVSLLMQRLEVPENIGGPLFMSGLMQAVGRLVGGWKYIQSTYKIA